MRDLLFSLLIGGSVVIGTTEVIGVTHVLEGQSPGEVLRAAVPDLPSDFPNSLIPEKARTMFTGDASAAADPTVPAGADPRPMFISRTGGSGVRARLACGDEAPAQGPVPEGTRVAIVRQGGAECPGWALVNSGAFEFWVRMQYLDASAPKAAGKSADKAPPKDERKSEANSQKDQESNDEGKRKSEATPTPAANAPTPAASATAAPTEPPGTATASPTAEPTSFAGPKRPPKVPVRDEPKDEES